MSFQNCSKGFETADLSKSDSSQCKVHQKADAQKRSWLGAELNCDDANSYSCERRVFSPEVKDQAKLLTKCLPRNEFCVKVELRQFDTSVARGPSSNETDFLPGGTYNHEEVKCAHRQKVNGISVFTGDKATLEEALSEAMTSCKNATENG